jgi:hypothetical protein
MAHMLEKSRPRPSFASADVLSEYGETLCVPKRHYFVPAAAGKARLKIAAPVVVAVEARVDAGSEEQDAERWDGLS